MKVLFVKDLKKGNSKIVDTIETKEFKETR